MPFPSLPDDVIDTLVKMAMEMARREAAGRPLVAQDTIRILVRLVEAEIQIRLEQQADDPVSVA